MANRSITTRALKAKKRKGEKIAALTAYDHPTARILDEAGVDIILVGDSAASVVLGYDSTLPISMAEMLMLTAAVARGAKRAMVVADMPFMSYQLSPKEALANAGRFVKQAGAQGIKLEGGHRTLPAVETIVAAGIPVMGHLGLTPQSHLQFGGYRIQGRDEAAAQTLREDALALEAAGVFAIVLEGIPWTLAQEISESLAIPTLGIGAGDRCDGQILVLHDMLGFQGGEYRFVKRYEDLEGRIHDAVSSYCREVREGRFPSSEHRFEAEAGAESAKGAKPRPGGA
jgi:3-methyl-2-oxobutanoate hydroxymethyltransferase